MVEGLQEFVNWWNYFVDREGFDSTYVTWTRPINQYWEQMIIASKIPCVDQETTFYEFWSRILPLPIVALDDAFANEDNFGMDDNEDHYCGSARNKPRDEFNPQIDVSKGSFVFVRPSSSIYPVWLGVATSDVDKEKKSETFLKVMVQYWAPITKNKNASEAYVYKDF